MTEQIKATQDRINLTKELLESLEIELETLKTIQGIHKSNPWIPLENGYPDNRRKVEVKCGVGKKVIARRVNERQLFATLNGVVISRVKSWREIKQL